MCNVLTKYVNILMYNCLLRKCKEVREWRLNMTAQGMATGPADSLVQYCTPISVFL